MNTRSDLAGPAGEAFQARVERDFVEASGPDAEKFLQGQLSQDVAGLAVGASAYSLLLQPQGKIEAWLRVTRLSADSYLLDVEGGWGEAVLARLNRFKLRTKCELVRLDGWHCWAVRGGEPSSVGDGGTIVADVGWPGVRGFDRLGVGLEPLENIPVVGTDRYVGARVGAGVPALGAELDDHTIPAEAGQWLIDRSVSFTKGCYTGQELVARIDSRGSNTPRKLRLITASTGLRVGASVVVDGVEVGIVTSANAEGSEALAYCKRAVEPPVSATVGTAEARVQVLPEG